MKKQNTNEQTQSVKRGRPVVEGSRRQAVLAMRAAKVAAGGEIKRGRPAGTKKVDDVVVKVKLSKAQKQAAMTKTNDVAEVEMAEA